MQINSGPVFTEIQKFDSQRTRFIAIMLSILIIVIFIFLTMMPLRAYPNLLIWWFAGFGIMLIADVVIFFNSITINIDNQGIQFKEMPSKQGRLFEWKDIDQVFYRHYKYGIWGIKSTFKNGLAFNVKGKAGIQIILAAGAKFQIGIENIDDAKAAIEFYLKREILLYNE